MPRLLKDRTTVPPGGFKYRVPETGVLFQGFTLAAVARDVSRHLATNGVHKTSHEVAQLVEEQICHDHPEACYAPAGRAKVKPFTAEKRPGHKWSLSEIKNGIDVYFRHLRAENYVPLPLAMERASVCSTCPLNVHSEACVTCTSGLLFMVKAKMGRDRVNALDARFTGERKLKLCDACGCFPVAKCQLKLDAVISSTPAAAIERIKRDAPRCWILKETGT